jgi:hypothetical protein
MKFEGRDLTPEQVQVEIFRRMTPEQRGECCARWTELTYEFARAGVRSMHPDWTPAQIEREVGRRITGIDVTKLDWDKINRQQAVTRES